MSGAAKTGAGGLPHYEGFQLTALVTLRMLVGWHFLYEGVAKLSNPYWTSAGYLQEAQGWFRGLFQSINANPTVLTAVDYLNQWGLLLIGLALLVGVFTRLAGWGAAILLFLYYVAAPPFPGMEYSIPTEGSYLIVNKILIEFAAVLVLLGFPTSHQVGLDRLFVSRSKKKAGTGSTTEAAS